MLTRNLISHLPTSIYIIDDIDDKIVAFKIVKNITFYITETHFCIDNLMPQSINVELALADHTISSLIDALRSYDLEIIAVNSAVLTLSAESLAVKDVLDDSQSILVNNDILSIIAHIAATNFAHVDEQLVNMMYQLVLTTSRGEFADLWGDYFDVSRMLAESDSDYTTRIVAEIFRPRNNKYAIESTLETITKTPANIYEPWTALSILDSSSELDTKVMIDGRYYTYNTIDVKSAADAEIIKTVGNKNRAAGVHLFVTHSSSIDNVDNVYDDCAETVQAVINTFDDSVSNVIVLDNFGYMDGVKEYEMYPARYMYVYDSTETIIIDPVWSSDGVKYHPAACGGTMSFPTFYFAHNYSNKTNIDQPITLHTTADFTISELTMWEYYCSAQYVYLMPVPHQAREFDSVTVKLLDVVGRRRKLKDGSYRIVKSGGYRYMTN